MKYKIYGCLWLIGAFIAQVSLPWAVATAYAERGYWAIGGEWGLLIVAIVAVCFGVDDIVKGFNEEYAESSMRHRESIKRIVKRFDEVSESEPCRISPTGKSSRKER